jgi:DNA-damage-inducible protein D
MTQQIVNQTKSVFEQIKKTDGQGHEYWSARDLAITLEYSEYRHFKPVIEKAKEACTNSGQLASDHFEHSLDMIEIGKGARREIDNVKLSRYACYLIVQNSSPDKEVVALGQTYFAVQTRLQEIQQSNAYNQLNTEEEKRLFLRQEMTRHNQKLATAAKIAGVITSIDYAIFQNHGYMGLYGGLDAKGIHKKKTLKKSQNILDHMGSTELAANLFRATQTEEKLSRENIKGKQKANKTHFEVGKKVRRTIEELGGTMPEDLPAADSIKKLENKSARQLSKSPTTKKKS